MARNDGGKAFPYSALCPDGPEIYKDSEGMTMRQWYKGQALSGNLIAHLYDSKVENQSWSDFVELIAESAGNFADAMVAEDEEFIENGEGNNEG